MITITMNDDYSLSSDSNIIPAQHSANILFYFDVLAEYADSLIVPGYIYYDGCTKVESAVDNYSNGEFTIPANAFSNEGVLAIAFAITTGEETVTTTPVEFEVRGSVNTSFSLPSTEIWQSMLQSFMDQYMDKVYSDEIRILIDKCKELQANGEILQELINLAINSCGQYKFENGFLFFKQADGSYGEGINLNVSVEEFENVVRRVTNLETNGIAVGDTLPIGTIVYVEGDEKDLRTGYEKIDVFPPKQLLINNDFQVWQRGESFDYSNSVLSKNTYFPDMWMLMNKSENFIISKTENGKGCNIELKTANSYVDLRQVVYGYKVGDIVTMSVKISNPGEEFIMKMRIGNDGNTNKNTNILKGEHIYELTYTLKDSDFRSDDGFYVCPFLGNSDKTFNVVIEYVFLFEGSAIYPQAKKSYMQDFLECQRYFKVLRLNWAGYITTGPMQQTFLFEMPMISNPTVLVRPGTTVINNVSYSASKDRFVWILGNSTTGNGYAYDYIYELSCEP
nr:MAG TPA: hypothetical protein [Caudoviricetes sp.]